MWLDLFFNTVACIGLCFILKYGTILDTLRRLLSKIKFFADLFSCSMCLGFWSGLAIAIITCAKGHYIILWPLYGSTVCWFADYVLDIVIKLGDSTDSNTLENTRSEDVTLLNE